MDLIDLMVWLLGKTRGSPISGRYGLSRKAQAQWRARFGSLNLEDARQLPPALCTDVQEWVEGGSPAPALDCHWFLRELYSLKGDYLFHLFKERAGSEGVLACGCGQPIPVPRLDLKSVGIAHPTTRQPNYGIRLLGNDLCFEVELDFRWAAQLAPLTYWEETRKPLVFGAAVLNASDQDFITEHDEHYFWTRPVSDSLQAERVSEMLEGAREQGVHVLVLPELALTSTARERILQHIKVHDRPCVVIGGLAHQGSPERGFSNHCGVWAGHLESLQVKRNPFQDPKKRLIEHLELEAGKGEPLRLIHTGEWTLGAVICLDFLSRSPANVQGLLEDACVNLAAVPAWSAKTDLFGRRANALIAECQAFVIVANNCPTSGSRDGYQCHAAIFGIPADGSEVKREAWNAENSASFLFTCQIP